MIFRNVLDFLNGHLGLLVLFLAEEELILDLVSVSVEILEWKAAMERFLIRECA